MELNHALKIFIVDDDLFTLALYQQQLTNLGYQDITVHENGASCLNDLVLQPDVIFLDHGMDGMNGVEVLKKIKRFNPDAYVVFISGQDDVQTAVNSLKYGAFDYIVKGDSDVIRIEKVLEKIQAVQSMLKKSKKGLLRKILPV